MSVASWIALDHANRAWHVMVDKPASAAAGLLRIFIAVGIPIAVVSLLLGNNRPVLIHPINLAWAYALLWAVRQRDEARAALARAERP